MTSHITFRSIFRVLASGFAAVIVLLVAGGAIGIQNARVVHESTAYFVLLSVALALAVACAALTVKITSSLFRNMEWQSRELSQVTWHMLENQETTARRFSHELHDELGQTLMAIKANLSAVLPGREADRARLEDCVDLIDNAVRDVRELSQLLHPTILDDFGLDAGLRWLAERFTQRTGTEVDYRSEFSGRLTEETETHVFRIVQEALTNVARHAGATKVEIRLESRGDRIHLALRDNGKGIQNGNQRPTGMGLTGMRARARTAGGELTIESRNGNGVSIELWAPSNGPKSA